MLIQILKSGQILKTQKSLTVFYALVGPLFDNNGGEFRFQISYKLLE